MNYRFELSKPNTTEFRCEIAIGAEQTFQQFHDKIVETLGFDASQMASFFTLDQYGNRVKEISLMDMSTGEEGEPKTLVMENTTIRDAINAACIELDYVYDYFMLCAYRGALTLAKAGVLPKEIFKIDYTIARDLASAAIALQDARFVFIEDKSRTGFDEAEFAPLKDMISKAEEYILSNYITL